MGLLQQLHGMAGASRTLQAVDHQDLCGGQTCPGLLVASMDLN